MAFPFPLQTEFAGMAQDRARDLMAGDVLWNCVDFIPVYLGSPLRKRGGWSYASRALGASTYIDGVTFAPFASGEKNIAIGQDHNVYTFTTGAESSLGAAFAVAQNPVFHRSGAPTLGTVIIPAASGTTTPKSYDGVTFGDLGGTPPQGKYADVWNDRTLLANGTQGGVLYPNRLWFGPIGNAAATWDTANSWEDVSLPITGIGVLKTAIMLFHAKSTERLRGSTPATASAIGDLALDAAFSVGCIDARSIVKYNDTLLWADVRGVYQTDGATLRDLTATGGMRTYWRSVLAAYSASYTVAAGVYNDTYIVSIMNGTTFVDCLAYDLTHGFWYRLANFGARCFTRQGSTFEESYMGLAGAGRVASLSSILSPSASTKNDADGTPVQPYFETAFYRGFMRLHRRWISSFALQQWKNLFFNYDLRDAASDAPTLTVSWATDPGASSYTAISRTIAASTKYTRVRRDIGFSANGIMLKVAQTHASSDTRVSGFEADYAPLDAGRLAQ